MEETKLTVPGTEAADKPQESFETLDYVKELFLHAEQQEKNDKKKLLYLRLICLFLAVIMAAVVLSAVFAGPYVKTAVQDFHAIAEKVRQIDINALTAQMELMMSDATKAINEVRLAAENLTKLDIDGLNGALSELTKTVENLGKMDIEALNSAIEALNSAAQKIANFKLFG